VASGALDSSAIEFVVVFDCSEVSGWFESGGNLFAIANCPIRADFCHSCVQSQVVMTLVRLRALVRVVLIEGWQALPEVAPG
jgi:hypothetical protein